MSPQDFIFEMLSKRLTTEAFGWLEKTAAQLRMTPNERLIYTSFGTAIRYSGKGPLEPVENELNEADNLLPGWNPLDWTLDQASRIVLLLSLPATPVSARWMDNLYQTSDLGETLALMKALPMLPLPNEHLDRALLGARSNIKSQFEAVAVRNPYPCLHFDELAWNQMVSKAIFVDTPLQLIVGLDLCNNPALNRILTDLVRERQAAGRSFDPWLYRCIAPVANETELDLLESILKTGSPPEREATIGGLIYNRSPRALHMLRGVPVHHPIREESRPPEEHSSHVR